METSGGLSKDFPGDLGAGKGVSSTDPLSDPLSGFLAKGDKGDKELGLTETDLLSYDPAAPSHGLSETASKETNRFLDELMSDAMNIVPNVTAKDENEGKITDSKKLVDDFDFGFEKPLPPEPLGAVNDFLKSEIGILHDKDLIKPEPKDDFLSTPEPPPEKSRTPSPAPREETPSPVPPPVPKHQPLRDDSPEPYEPTQTPEPESEFKPVLEAPRDPSPPPVRPREPTPPPREPTPPPREPTPPPREPTPPPKEPTPPPVRPREPSPPRQKPVEPPPPVKKISTEDIGVKDIRSKLNGYRNDPPLLACHSGMQYPIWFLLVPRCGYPTLNRDFGSQT
ncbi:hypothetical protein GE061_013687 [Apolygus lucorum]|uniref:Uncharacterized protein n=1 Tax=Apolygus lucorum TaxID=248454 RepID=A0A8S9XQJ3_APOLU|nr:hypothetical protein GE061_013687 [Apolygus lucorum]